MPGFAEATLGHLTMQRERLVDGTDVEEIVDVMQLMDLLKLSADTHFKNCAKGNDMFMEQILKKLQMSPRIVLITLQNYDCLQFLIQIFAAQALQITLRKIPALLKKICLSARIGNTFFRG